MSKKRPAPRYSILPGDFADFRDKDGNPPRLVHFVTLFYLGRYTDRAGWFKRSLKQDEMAEEVGLSRQKFCAALNDLIEWGFVERKPSKKSKRVFYYRVLMDRAEPIEDDDDELSPDGDISQSDAKSPDGDSGAQQEMSPSGDTSIVTTRLRQSHQAVTEKSPPGDTALYPKKDQLFRPLTHDQRARAREERVCEGGKPDAKEPAKKPPIHPLIEELRAEGEHLHVVDEFLAPLVGALRSGGDDLPFLLRAIRDDLAEFSPQVLAKAAADIRAKRTQWPSVAVARQACLAAQQTQGAYRIERGTLAWSAWMDHLRRTGQKFSVKLFEDQGYMIQRSEYPPVNRNQGGGNGYDD